VLHYPGWAWLTAQGIASADESAHLGCISRGQFAQWLYALAGSPSVAEATRSFDDVPAGAAHHNAIVWDAGERIFRDWHQFHPNNTMTRGAAAAFIFRAHYLAGLWPQLG